MQFGQVEEYNIIEVDSYVYQQTGSYDSGIL